MRGLAEKKCAKQRFRDFLAEKKLCIAAQREAIIELAFNTKNENRNGQNGLRLCASESGAGWSARA
jgi:hypothetical protein